MEAFAEITGDELGDVDAFAELVSLAVAKDPRLAAAGAHALDSANSRGAAASAAGEPERSWLGLHTGTGRETLQECSIPGIQRRSLT